MSKRRYRCQVAVADSGQRDKGVPERVAESTDSSVFIAAFGKVEKGQKPNVDALKLWSCTDRFSFFFSSWAVSFFVFSDSSGG